MKYLLSIMLSCFSVYPNSYVPTTIEERLKNSEVVIIAKVLSFRCMDRETLLDLKMEKCKTSYIRADYEIGVRAGKVLKGKPTFLKENSSRQKIKFRISAMAQGRSLPKIGVEQIFFFNSRDLAPSLAEGRNYVSVKNVDFIEKLLNQKSPI